jgi:hypothetical protein
MALSWDKLRREDERALQIRRAAVNVVDWLESHRGRSGAISALTDALLLVDTRHNVTAAERDERTRDLDELILERDAAIRDAASAMASRDIAIERCDYYRNERDCARHDLSTLTDDIATVRSEHEATRVRLEQAKSELDKARAMVEELREQLAAPTIHSASVAAWLALPEDVGMARINFLRLDPLPGEHEIADVLDSLSMQAPEPDGDERAGVPTDAAGEIERLQARVTELEEAVGRHRAEQQRLQRVHAEDVAAFSRAMVAVERDKLRADLAERPTVDAEKIAAWRAICASEQYAVTNAMRSSHHLDRWRAAGELLEPLARKP